MDDPNVNPTPQDLQDSHDSHDSQPLHQNDQNNENTQNNQEEINYNANFNCSFCNVSLYGGMDDNNLMHCQNCHNVWDGNAQCMCYFYN